MKNLFIIILLITLISCKKNKDEDPKPVQIHNPTDTTINPTDSSDDGGANTTPIFNSTSIEVVSDGSAKVVDISSLIHDAEGKTMRIKSIEPMTNVSNVSGTTFTVTPSNSVFAGAISYTIIVTDETSDSEPTSITVNYGTPAQITTYNTISPFFGQVLNGTAAGIFVISSNGTITSNTNLSFYGDASTTATYKIIGSSIEITSAGGTVKTHTVSPRTVGSAGFNMGTFNVHL